ncbi:hypothetical protein PVK06_007567 [Gossypium arboreum]|uniref:Uncharacterized protein n=1 Tax=Gossypium arboreum TaxID=29729 RepID=A0ABR0QHP1_GOSAR|nr:hypothetical protein PVK06_007567 [Gossypium arboreum]
MLSGFKAEPRHKFSPSLPSSTYFLDGSLSRVPDSLTESETVNWKVIAARDFGSAELRRRSEVNGKTMEDANGLHANTAMNIA